MNTSNDNGTSRANSELAIDGLLNGIKTFGTGADSVGHIFKHVFDVVSGFVGRSGKEEDVAVHLEKIIEYIQKTPDLAGNLLHCYILYRVAQVFTQQKHMEKAKQYFYSAQKIAASRRSELEFIKWEIGIWENLMSIHDALGEKKQLLHAEMEYVKTCEPILRSPPAGWLSENLGRILVGVARACFGIGSTHNNEEPINIGIKYLQEALRLEKDRNPSEPSDSGVQPWILLQLSELYYSTDSEIGQCVGQFASWNFLEQAIAGLQQVGCTCSSDSIDSSLSTLSWEEKGMSDCARHQLLADAYIFQGRVQQNHGFMVEAQKSFEEGLYLVEQCNDMKREAWFHLELAHHLFLKSHMYTNSCLHVEDSPQYTKPLSQQIVGHYRDFLKKYTPSVVFAHDQMVIYARAFINAAEDPNVTSRSNGFNRAAHMEPILDHLQRPEVGRDCGSHAVYHECLSVHYYRMGDMEACKKHTDLALHYMHSAPSKCVPLRACQTLGWISMAPNSSNLQLPYNLWMIVFKETLQLQELMTGTSEDHALRYFELNKRACMALATCEILRDRESVICPDSKKPAQNYAERALVWTERGNGRMLMSFIEASTQSTDNVASQFDSRRFLSDDTYALNFICNMPQASQLLSPSSKTVFIEYSFLSYDELLIYLVTHDPSSGRTVVQYNSDATRLHCELPEGIRRQAENYLEESLQGRSEAGQSSIDSVAPATVQKLLSALNKYSTKRKFFNPWTLGMIAGIQKHVGQAIKMLTDNPDAERTNEKAAISELLQLLFKVLIKPIKKQLDAAYKPGDTLVFLPHEDLGTVPFAALHESDGSRYLIEDYAISVSPSLWCTRHCQHLYEKTARSGCDEGVGPPVLVGKKSGYPPGWNNLKQAHKEVDAVAEAMRSVTASTVLKDTGPDELSQARMLEVLPTASWVHLSVHGEVSSQFPQGSLLFSDNDGQRLAAEQIITLAPSGWRARAVVASACQTGLGAVAGGGILGFARAFILAGVPSSVLALWEAPATFCTEFMKKLYEQLALGYSLAHAMQNAVIFMMHEPKKVRKGDRKGKGKVGKGEDGELKWTIFDWASLSCFGLPSVTLPMTELVMAEAADPSIEDGTACSSDQHALVEKSEEPCVLPGREDKNPGLVITDAILGLLHGVIKFGMRKVDEIFEHVLNVVLNIEGRSGSNQEGVVIDLEKVVEYIEYTPWLAGSLLHCHFLYRTAQVFTLQKHMDRAKLRYYAAQKISASRCSKLEYLILEIGTWENLISLHDTLGEEKLSLAARMEYVKVCKPLLLLPEVWPSRGHYKRTLVKVGRACFNVGRTCNDMEKLEDGISYLTEALKVEGEKTTETFEQGMILMQLSEFHYQANSEFSEYASSILLEQVIAGLQEVGCTCSYNSIKSSLRSSIWQKPGVFGCGLHLLLPDAYIFQGKVFMQQGHMERAKQSFELALVIVANRSDTECLKRESSIWENLTSIHDQLGQQELLLLAKRKYVEICELLLLSPPAWRKGELRHILVKVGRACFEIGKVQKNLEQIEDGINYLTEALRMEGNKMTEASEQAWILMQLSKFYYQTNSEFSVYANWILLEQAIAGYQEVECTCNSESSDSSLRSIILEELPEMSGCGRHQLLADAFLFLGFVQQDNGFLEEAQKNFERSSELLEKCNDKARQGWVSLELLHHSTLMKPHMHTNACYHMFDGIPQFDEFPDEQILDRYRFFLKNYCSSDAAFKFDQLAVNARAISFARNDPKALSDPNGFRAAMVRSYHKQLQLAVERGDYENHAVYHECLSIYYYRMGDMEACKTHYDLAYKYLGEVPSKTIILRVLLSLGWLAFIREISDFEGAYILYQLVFRETVKLQDNFAEISEDHALRYFEHSKYACVALAKCQMKQLHKSLTCPDSQKPPQSYEGNALVWAERGKGRMLMSFIEASTQSTDNPASQIFDSHRFLKDDDPFAFNFIGRNTTRVSGPLQSQSRKTIFVEYTYIDRYNLMIHVVIDDPISGCTSVIVAAVVCLDCELPGGIRRQAKKYLDESVQHRPQTAQSSTGSAETVLHRVVSAMNKYSTKWRAYNPYIPGMVVGIQKHVGQAIDKLKRDKTSRCMNEKAAISELLQLLFKVLIKPIKKQLDAAYKPGDTLVFLPHEDLGTVPFAALHESDGSRYLIEDYAISVSPSLWCTRHCQHLYEKTARSGCDEGVGPPVLVGKKSGYPPGWNNLKQAHKEVDAVAEAMRSVTASTVLKDTGPDELSQARMLEVLPTASWVHLSVHGEVSSQFPQGSLLFSDNDGQRLAAEQIITLAPSGWRARAVVASACQTGLGAVAGGGILGFARAFILAGVPSSVLALWEAPATFCTEFMKKLYEQLALGYSLAHAMQNAVIFMMHEPKKVRKGDRKGKGKVGKGEDGELKWTIFDWACLSCFGLPSVTLPNVEKRIDSN